MSAAPTLVIMAAGIGSRYGGIKQIEPVGPNGELITDYSAWDALHEGFGRVVFIITREIERDFRERASARIERHMDVEYAFQSLDDLPPGRALPAGRTKPWGTVHAVLAARRLVQGRFAVINADDYYGPQAFELMSRWLRGAHADGPIMQHAMIAYTLEHTLSEAGAVTRGVCEIGASGLLERVTERRGVERAHGHAVYRDPSGASGTLPLDASVSMNFWGLDARFMAAAEEGLPRFLDRRLPEDPLGCEYLLPDEIDAEIREGRAEVSVMSSEDQWHGVTYREDRASVAGAIDAMHRGGRYPMPLWG